MARQYTIGGVGYVNETGSKDYTIASDTSITETASAPAPPTIIFRRTLSAAGTRVGSRQGES